MAVLQVGKLAVHHAGGAERGLADSLRALDRSGGGLRAEGVKFLPSAIFGGNPLLIALYREVGPARNHPVRRLRSRPLAAKPAGAERAQSHAPDRHAQQLTSGSCRAKVLTYQ